jgi:hypothetical protein
MTYAFIDTHRYAGFIIHTPLAERREHGEGLYIQLQQLRRQVSAG